MFKNLSDRRNIAQLVFSLVFIVMIVRLGYITIIEGDMYREKSINNSTKRIPEIAKRGDIYDRNGKLLAGNVPAFTVQLMGSNLSKEEMNRVSLKVMNILDSRKEDHILFPIQKDGNGFYYVFDKEKDNWLIDKGFTISDTPEIVLQYYRDRESLSADLSSAEAYKVLLNKGIIVPISVSKMQFWTDVEKNNFLKMYDIDGSPSASDAFATIKALKSFGIPADESDSNALKILSLKNALKEKGYRKYDPIKLADNVSRETAIILKEMSMDLPGIDIVVEPIRTYPYKNAASHILGYMGKISSESEINKYITQNGYLENQLIGKSGIEGNLELDLKGDNGYKFIEVDAYGKMIREIDQGVNGEGKVQPKSGKDVYLTIDIDLQQKLEKHLKDALNAIQVGGVYQSPWGNYKYNQTFRNAKTGAAVVVNVNTGEVLAMASYPDYDPNVFAAGINSNDWKMLAPDNPRDPLSPRPLYNTATLSAVQPGSTYKMVTGYAALKAGMDPNRSVRDGQHIDIGGSSYGCWLWNQSRASHGMVNLFKALEVSCNYYFFDAGSGYDYANKSSLGYSLSTQQLLNTSKTFGLGSKTGIEIEESGGGIPDPEKKKRSIMFALKQQIRQNAYDYFKPEIANNETRLNVVMDTIIGWADESPSRGDVIKKLKAFDVVNANFSLERLADIIKFDYFNSLKWGEGDRLNLSIGQGDHRYTPIQMARYIAAIANGGKIKTLTLINKIGGKSNDALLQKNEAAPSFDTENLLRYIRQGMYRVTTGDSGTATAVFRRFPIAAAGKTGTAQNQGKIPPRDEIAYLKTYLRAINGRLTWAQVETKSKEILKTRSKEMAALQSEISTTINPLDKEKMRRKVDQKFAQGYLTQESALRAAIIQLSNRKIGDEQINQFRSSYDNYAWFVAYAPFDKPEIAVVVMIPQGGHGGYSAPVARDTIADYLHLDPANYNLGGGIQSGAGND